jgi:hypothetical protein
MQYLHMMVQSAGDGKGFLMLHLFMSGSNGEEFTQRLI